MTSYVLKPPEASAPGGSSVGFVLTPPEKPSAVEDIVQSLPGAPIRAAANVVGLPRAVSDLVEGLRQKISEKLGPSVPEWLKTPQALQDLAMHLTPAGALQSMPKAETIERGYDEIAKLVSGDETAKVYRPQTGPGRIADTTAQVVVSGPGSLTQKAVTGAAGGVAGEGARQLTNDPILIGVAQMLGMGAASIPFIVRSVPAENIHAALKGVTEDQLKQAQSLMDDATRMGTPLTGAEALAQVVGKNKLQDIQRVVEGSKESSSIMEPMMNARPNANKAAFATQANTIAPSPANPSQTPVKLQETASKVITAARKEGNAAAEPFYNAAAGQRIASQEWNSLSADPAVAKALQAVKADPIWGVANEAEGSIRWLDAAKKWIDGELHSANPSVARIYEAANAKIKAAADAASPDYAKARAIVADNRQNVVKPLQNSPVGDVANSGAGHMGQKPNAETMMRTQSEVLMPEAPRALDPMTIRETVRNLAKQDPNALRDWTRQNLEGIFNEAAQNNVGGANQWGGAKFAAKVSGNVTQRDNLQALIDATAGRQAWVGFNRMLEVMEAQGKRLAPGSNTQRDIRTAENLSAAGLGGAPATMASPTRLTTIVYDWYQNFRYGKNTSEMATILTDPKSIDLMKQLAKEAPHTAKAQALTAQIIGAEPIGSNDR